MKAIPPAIETLVGEVVVLDLQSRFVYVGTLMETQGDYLLMSDVDVHDLRDTPSTRDQYVLQCRRDGMTPNRQWTWVRQEEIVGISRLSDVIID